MKAELLKKLRWFHWVGLSVAIACATALVVTGHVSVADVAQWLVRTLNTGGLP